MRPANNTAHSSSLVAEVEIGPCCTPLCDDEEFLYFIQLQASRVRAALGHLELQAEQLRVSVQALTPGTDSFYRVVIWSGIGRGDDITPVELPVGGAVVEGNRGTYRRPDESEEWYMNGPLGVEQGFVVAQGPVGDSADLVLELTVEGALTPAMSADGTNDTSSVADIKVHGNVTKLGGKARKKGGTACQAPFLPHLFSPLSKRRHVGRRDQWARRFSCLPCSRSGDAHQCRDRTPRLEQHRAAGNCVGGGCQRWQTR